MCSAASRGLCLQCTLVRSTSRPSGVDRYKVGPGGRGAGGPHTHARTHGESSSGSTSSSAAELRHSEVSLLPLAPGCGAAAAPDNGHPEQPCAVLVSGGPRGTGSVPSAACCSAAASTNSRGGGERGLGRGKVAGSMRDKRACRRGAAHSMWPRLSKSPACHGAAVKFALRQLGPAAMCATGSSHHGGDQR